MNDGDLLARVRDRLAATGTSATAQDVAVALQSEGRVFSSATVLSLVDALHAETVGAGHLQPLLAEPGVTDVLVNGAESVFVDRGKGLERINMALGTEADVRRLAQRLAAQAGRRLDDASPCVDGRLPGGARLHAVLAPVARPGTVISLRVPQASTLSLDDLSSAGSLTPTMRSWLERLVRAQVAFVVTGGTGSGKTTLLGALLAMVPPDERIVCVEEASELRPFHPHVVGLEARGPNIEGAGVISVQDLVRQALRMRPDRLVVGEVRGAEVVDLLAALNTGHTGGCGTVHANSVADLPARFEALAVAAGMSRTAVHSQVAAGVAAAVHVRRRADGTREVGQIGVIRRNAEGWVECVVAADSQDDADCPGAAALAALVAGT